MGVEDAVHPVVLGRLPGGEGCVIRAQIITSLLHCINTYFSLGAGNDGLGRLEIVQGARGLARHQGRPVRAFLMHCQLAH